MPKAKLGSIVTKARHERKTHKAGVGINPTSSDDMNDETTVRPGPGENEPKPDPNPTSTECCPFAVEAEPGEVFVLNQT